MLKLVVSSAFALYQGDNPVSLLQYPTNSPAKRWLIRELDSKCELGHLEWVQLFEADNFCLDVLPSHLQHRFHPLVDWEKFLAINDLDMSSAKDSHVGILLISHNGIDYDILIPVMVTLSVEHFINGIHCLFIG
jgi:hypothetical protein